MATNLHEISYLNETDWEIKLHGLLRNLINDKAKAFFFSQNMIGLKALRVFKKMKVQVPGDISVVCFDSHIAFELFDNGITCYEQLIKAIASRSVAIVTSILKEKNHAYVSQLKIDGKLILRVSCSGITSEEQS